MTSSDSQRYDDFDALRTRVLELIEEGRLDAALRAALQVEERHPDRGEVPFWVACVHGRASRADEGLAALRGGLARGLWWPDEWLLEDDDLAAVRDTPGFDEILEQSRANEEALGEESVAESVILAPDRDGETIGVVLALHGWGGAAVDFGRAWWSAADAGYVVVVPESSQMPTPGFFVWNDHEQARADVQSVWDEASATHGLAALPLVVAGFSQGGGRAGARRRPAPRGAPPPPAGRAGPRRGPGAPA